MIHCYVVQGFNPAETGCGTACKALHYIFID